ncbi:aldehyde dehydrogenase [Amycolatopsis rhabdoformis]|uniref:Aldehyde dehydrogenase n=1 Tax=Amycolatopsis rhabdoformis TaxID=1448059 RepID=A0ABZ1ICY5_9PSEU|nr:aldehyde dehydrogenase [Amycolatopsis rhabdoformis]WSE32324.1 aldehyde dehydrogenase [Amycolatopsis rhabdoformis]
MTDHELTIGGKWRPAVSGATYETVNPYTGRPWARVPDAGAADVDAAVSAARTALDGEWGALTGFERAALMRRLADIVEREAERLAVVETTDNGKLLRETRQQTAGLATWLRYFSGVADKLHGETIPGSKPNYFVYTREEPVGVIAAIVPWNSPLALLHWKLAPALAAGCTLVVKPSESTPASALEYARLVEEAGFPPGVLNVITGQSAELGRALVDHPGVDKIAFTGSPAVGAAIASSAGARLTPVLLELGGKSAQVVLPDADLEAAANGVVAGIFAAGGQTCIAGSRLVVHRDVRERLLGLIVDRAKAIRLGDPLLPETEMGPLANKRQLDTVLGFIDRAVATGASVVAGGRRDPSLGGLFVEPTILTGVARDAEIAQEEVFGPVLTVLDVASEDEAVAVANGTRFSLGAGLWTSDVGRAHRVAARLRAGTVWVNSYRAVAPNVPFGGNGASGWGRENGRHAVDEFLQTKAVWIETSGEVRDPFVVG